MAGFDREAAKAAGYTDDEIDAHLAKDVEPRASEPFMKRLDQGLGVSKILGKLGTASKAVTSNRISDKVGEGFENGFGEEPLGFVPGSEVTMFLQKHGVFSDPETGSGGMVRLFNEATLRPLAAGFETIGRVIRGGAFAVGGLFGALAEEAGASPGTGEMAKRDLGNMGDIAATLLGATPHMPMIRTRRMPNGAIHEEPLGGFPTRQDFSHAAEVVTGGAYDPKIEQKLLKLYDDHGFHPAEVIADADRDPVLKQQLLSRDDAMPEALVRGGEKSIEEPAKPPGTVRVYHGGDDTTGDPNTSLWFTTGRKYAEGYATRDGRKAPVWYVDLPEDHPMFASDYPEQGVKQGFTFAKNLPPEDIQGRKRLDGEPPAGGGGKPPEPPDQKTLPPPEGDKGPFQKVGEEDSLRLAQKEVMKGVSVGESPSSPKIDPDRVYEWTVDKLFPIKRAAEDARSRGLDVPVTEDPYVAGRLYSGWAGKVEVALKYEGPFDFFSYDNVGPSLKEILSPVKDMMDDFRAFLVSARATELAKRGVETNTPLEAARIVGSNATPVMKEAAKKLYKFQNQVAAYLRDSGVISHAGYDAMLEANQFYVPFHRLLDEEGLGISPRGASLQPQNPLHRIEGSLKKKIDPLESVIKNTFIYMAMAERNVVATKMVNMLRGADAVFGELKLSERSLVRVEDKPGGEVSARITERLAAEGVTNAPTGLLDMLQSAQPLRADEIAVFEKGVRNVYRVDEDVARAIKGLDQESMHWMIQALAYPARLLRAGSVFNPDFWARHLFREQFYASTTYEHGIFTPVDSAKGLAGMVIRDPDFIDWMKGGGGHVSLMALDRNYLQENLQELTAKTGLMTRGWNMVRHPLTPLQAGTEVALSASHLGAFKKRLRMLEGQTAEKVQAPGGVLPAPEDHFPRIGKLGTENLPAPLRGKELQLRDGVSVADAMRSFDYDPVTGEFTDIATKDLSAKRSIIDAAWVSRDTSIDNTRIGSKMRAVNMISTFANARVQDVTRGTVETFMRNPVRTTLLVGGGIVLPSALLWYANQGDSRYERMNLEERDRVWAVPTDRWESAKPQDVLSRPPDQVRINAQGQLEVNNGTIIRFPKPFTLGVLYGSGMERLLDAWAKERPGAWRGFFSSLIDQTVGDLVPTAVVPAVEQYANKTRASGRNLIPSHLEGQLPEYQYTPYTTELAKKIGMMVSSFPGIHNLTADKEHGAIGAVAAAASNPILVENMVRGWTGTLGTYVFKALDVALRKTGALNDPPHAPSSLNDVPFVRAFTMRYPSANTEALSSFYEAVGRIEVLKKTFDARAKEGDLAGLERVQEIGGPIMFLKFQNMKQALHNQIRTINMIDGAPESAIPKDQKRQLIDSIYYQMHQVAESGSQQIHAFEKQLKGKP